jgi:hypothetical protein
MRFAISAVAIGAFALAACSGGDAGSKGVSEDDVRSELASATQLNPGQYAANFEIVRFDVPGMPADQQSMIREMMAGAAQVQNSYCLTDEQARRGGEDMFREMAKGSGDCRFDSFEVDGTSVSGVLSCTPQGSGRAVMRMSGTMASTRTDLTLTTDITDSSLPQGRAQMEMRVASRRTGDCTAESRAAAEAANKSAAE